MFRKKLVVRGACDRLRRCDRVACPSTPVAYAQSNATGTVFGSVPAGADSIVLENLGTNAKRTVTPDANGKFQATSLPPGRYKVSAMKGQTQVSSTEIEVLLGQGVEAAFAAAGAQQLQSVQVVGRAYRDRRLEHEQRHHADRSRTGHPADRAEHHGDHDAGPGRRGGGSALRGRRQHRRRRTV